MKILSISHLDIWPWGKDKGIPSVFASQKEFVKQGHQVYFVCPLRNKELARREVDQGVNIFRFRMPFNLSTETARKLPTDTFIGHIRATVYYNLEWLFFQIVGFGQLFYYAKKFKPQVIYVHTVTPALIGYIVSKIIRARLIIRLYGMRDLYYRYKQNRLWFKIKECKNYLLLKVPADYFIVTDDGNNADLLLEQLGHSADKIKSWRNGVDFEIYDDSLEIKQEVCNKLNINMKSKIIISTARMIPIYGVDLLVKALPEVFKNNADVVCVITSDGPDKNKIEQFIKAQKIENRVFFLGILEHQQLNKFLNASDIFVLLSRLHNCTNTMWEAMICGKCIITTANDKIKQVLKDKEDAILVSDQDAGGLNRLLDKLINDDQLRNKLGKNAHLKAAEVLESWPTRIEKEIKLIEQLVKR